jgi:magnesium-transporting ATPase (P-type)
MATLNHDHAANAFIFVKGAPERVIGMCRSQRSGRGDTGPVESNHWLERAAAIGRRGERVLAFAICPVAASQTVLEHADLHGTLSLLGLVGLIDPPRPGAVAAIAQCREAGIRVKMITGDHASTASAIGRQIGLDNAARVLTGADIDRMDDAALEASVVEVDVFARTSPEHKLRLVMALQARGMTVAMTGDGVNDAPALKRADAGIAMGRQGSEAAKEAAELVLLDDDFASIVAAVREGRTVYDNLRKVISWTLPTNAGEATTLIVAVLLGVTLPVTPLQIIWVNLVTAVTLGVALAFEPTGANAMRRPPRARGEPLLTGELVWQVALVSALFALGVFGMFSWSIARGDSVELARTIAVNTLVVMEIFQLLFIRNFHQVSLTWRAVRGTREVWLTIAACLLSQLAFTYLPPLQELFATEAIPPADLLPILGVGATLFALIEVEKQIRLRLKRPSRRSGMRSAEPTAASFKSPTT